MNKEQKYVGVDISKTAWISLSSALLESDGVFITARLALSGAIGTLEVMNVSCQRLQEVLAKCPVFGQRVVRS